MSSLFRELAYHLQYIELPQRDPDPMSEDHWLENMVEDRL